MSANMETQQQTNQPTQTDDVPASELRAAETAVNTLLMAVKKIENVLDEVLVLVRGKLVGGGDLLGAIPSAGSVSFWFRPISCSVRFR